MDRASHNDRSYSPHASSPLYSLNSPTALGANMSSTFRGLFNSPCSLQVAKQGFEHVAVGLDAVGPPVGTENFS